MKYKIWVVVCFKECMYMYMYKLVVVVVCKVNVKCFCFKEIIDSFDILFNVKCKKLISFGYLWFGVL